MSFLTRLSFVNRAVVILVSLVIIGFGLFSTTNLKQELIPSLQIPGATVVSVYPGANPQTIERDVTQPVEDALKAVQGVTKVNSVTANNLSQVQVEWDYNEDSTEMEGKVRTATDGLTSKLPEDVKPEVSVGSFDDLPVVMTAVSSGMPQSQLSAELDKVGIPKLEGVAGVKSAQLSGQETREIMITMRPADVDRLGVQTSQLQQLFESENTAIPAGSIKEQGNTLSVQVGAKFAGVDDIKAMQVQGTDGPVRLDAIADVADQPTETTTLARVNGQPSLSLSVIKNPDANTVTVAKDVRTQLDEISKTVGHDTKFTTVFDQSPFIEQSIHDLAVEGGLGLVMAVLVILLFLWSVKPTIITAISIPMSLLIAMIGLYLTDYTLNMLTLSALTVAVGRVVDDSIVVIENIKRHQGLGEAFGPEMIIGAVKEVAGAITASTITTVAVFLPIALVSGQTGELFRPFAMTVTIALLASLVVALTIVPVLSSWFMRPSRRAAGKAAATTAASSAESGSTAVDPASVQAPAASTVDRAATQAESQDSPVTGMQKGYLPVLSWTLRRPIITLVIALLVFVGTMGLSTQLKTDFLGDAGQTNLTINQKLPAGTTLEQTDAAAKKVEEVIAKHPEVETYQTSIGGGGQEDMMTGGGGSTNKATISLTLKPKSKATDLATVLRGEFAGLSDAGEVEVVTADAASGGGNELEVQVNGQNEQDLKTGSDAVATMLRNTPGMSQVKSDLSDEQTTLQVDVDDAKAAELGMSQGTIGLAVNEALKGTELGEITIGEDTQKVTMRSRNPVKTRAELEGLLLPVSEKQSADAKQKISDELEADQEAQADEQIASQEEELNNSDEQLTEQRSKLDEQYNELTDQLEQLRSAPAGQSPGGSAGQSLGGAGQLPGGAGQLPGGAAQQAQAQAAKQAQIEQLEKSVDEMAEQRESLQDQADKLDEQRTKMAEQRAKSEETKRKTDEAKNAKGTPVRLTEVATVREVKAPGTINRVDGARSVKVSAVPEGGDLTAATQKLNEGLAKVELPDGVTASIGGVSTEQNEAFAQLGLAMAIAIAIVYMVMVATFKSLLQPLILLVSVPFAATGAIGLLLITGTALGVPAMIGLLMLIGIVVTNAIVLIDLVNHYRSGGASIDDALRHGARLRLRPIVMTALATILALVPMGLSLTGGGVFISKSLAIVVIGGLVSSTLLTLILVPVLYHLIETAKEKSAERRHRRRGGHDATGGPDGPDGDVEQGPRHRDSDEGLGGLLGGDRTVPRHEA